jgi:hypothetical protein
VKYYCEKCRSVFEPGVLKMIDGVYSCPVCKKAMERIPYYETPQQYEKRTGKEFPKEGVVFFIYKNTSTGNTFWAIDNYDYAKWYADNHPGYKHIIVIGDPPIPPPDEWRPE